MEKIPILCEFCQWSFQEIIIMLDGPLIRTRNLKKLPAKIISLKGDLIQYQPNTPQDVAS